MDHKLVITFRDGTVRECEPGLIPAPMVEEGTLDLIDGECMVHETLDANLIKSYTFEFGDVRIAP